MKTLIVLVVIMMVSAHQASANSGYKYSYGYDHGNGQPRYVGPLASSVPAGVSGKIIPVSDTYEVAAARDHFSRTYKNQLSTIFAIRSIRDGSPGYGHVEPIYYGSVVPKHVSSEPYRLAVSNTGYGVSSYDYAGLPKQVGDTPAVAAAKAEFFRLYNKQAAAAAAAPDPYTHTHY